MLVKQFLVGEGRGKKHRKEDRVLDMRSVRERGCGLRLPPHLAAPQNYRQPESKQGYNVHNWEGEVGTVLNTA